MKLYAVLLLCLCSWGAVSEPSPEKVALGKLLFQDSTLSEPSGQSCSSCHNSQAAYADSGHSVSPGANPLLFGKRNAPSIAYVKFNPDLYRDNAEEHWVGGFFADGREKTLAAQAIQPLLDPLEMGNTSPEALADKVRHTTYTALIESLYGTDILASTEGVLVAVADALVAYEHGPEFATFTSKYDYYLRGSAQLTAIEKRGLDLFESEDKGNCASCHPSQLGRDGELPLFTDYTYDNLGLPTNPTLPYLGMAAEHNLQGKNFIDQGLSSNTHIFDPQEQRGKFKVSTLRNIARTDPYMHNGIFTTLEESVAFYNTRDIDAKWGEPEIPSTVNRDELGDLKLSETEVSAIVAFLRTLSDGYDGPTISLSIQEH